MSRIGTSDLDVFPLAFGGNVFGWTADRDTSFALLDAFVEAGGDFVDTADAYSAWVPGNSGGESERIIGEWLAARPGARENLVVATKVSQHPEFRGLAAANVRAAAEASLERLGVDTIAEQHRLAIASVERLGDDLLIVARPAQRPSPEGVH